MLCYLCSGSVLAISDSGHTLLTDSDYKVRLTATTVLSVLQCFDTAGWVIRPVKISSQKELALNLTQPTKPYSCCS